MPASYQVFTPLNLVYVRLSGTVTLHQIRDSLCLYVSDEAFDPTQRHLIDLRLVTDSLTLFWELKEIKKLYDRLYSAPFKPVNVTLVATSPISRRLAWMYSRVMKDKVTITLDVFGEIEPALKRLNVPMDAFDKACRDARNNQVIEFSDYKAMRKPDQ